MMGGKNVIFFLYEITLKSWECFFLLNSLFITKLILCQVFNLFVSRWLKWFNTMAKMETARVYIEIFSTFMVYIYCSHVKVAASDDVNVLIVVSLTSLLNDAMTFLAPSIYLKFVIERDSQSTLETFNHNLINGWCKSPVKLQFFILICSF